MHPLEDQRGTTPEVVFVARPRHGKPPHADPVDRVEAFRKLVLPGDVVARARRQDLDVGVPGQTFRDVSRVELGAAADVRAVALNNNCELHWAGASPSSGPLLSP